MADAPAETVEQVADPTEAVEAVEEAATEAVETVVDVAETAVDAVVDVAEAAAEAVAETVDPAETIAALRARVASLEAQIDDHHEADASPPASADSPVPEAVSATVVEPEAPSVPAADPAPPHRRRHAWGHR